MMGVFLLTATEEGREKGCDGRDERPPGDVPPFTRAMG